MQLNDTEIQPIQAHHPSTFFLFVMMINSVFDTRPFVNDVANTYFLFWSNVSFTVLTIWNTFIGLQ